MTHQNGVPVGIVLALLMMDTVPIFAPLREIARTIVIVVGVLMLFVLLLRWSPRAAGQAETGIAAWARSTMVWLPNAVPQRTGEGLPAEEPPQLKRPRW